MVSQRRQPRRSHARPLERTAFHESRSHLRLPLRLPQGDRDAPAHVVSNADALGRHCYYVLCCVVLPVFVRFREGKSNAHLNGDYQRIGDIVLNGMRVLQVRVDVHHVV